MLQALEDGSGTSPMQSAVSAAQLLVQGCAGFKYRFAPACGPTEDKWGR